MATPNARRVVFGSYAIPKLEEATTSTQVTREDGSTAGVATYDDVVLDTTINKRFGGKGTVTVAADQAYEGWVSFMHSDSVMDGIDVNWEDEYTNWDEVNEITSTDHTIREDSVNCNFLYAKNTGLTTEARVFLDGTEPDILLPPGASISIRLNSVASSNIKLDTASSSTTVEYVLTKE